MIGKHYGKSVTERGRVCSCCVCVCARVSLQSIHGCMLCLRSSAPIAFGSIINPGGQERQMKCQTSYQLGGRYSPPLSAMCAACTPCSASVDGREMNLLQVEDMQVSGNSLT